MHCYVTLYVELKFIDARGPNVFEDVMSANCAFNSEQSRHKGYEGTTKGSFDSLRIAHCVVGLYSNKTVNFAYKRPPPLIAQNTV